MMLTTKERSKERLEKFSKNFNTAGTGVTSKRDNGTNALNKQVNMALRRSQAGLSKDSAAKLDVNTGRMSLNKSIDLLKPKQLPATAEASIDEHHESVNTTDIKFSLRLHGA